MRISLLNQSESMFQDDGAYVAWEMFCVDSENNIDICNDSVTGFIGKWIEDVVPTVTGFIR